MREKTQSLDTITCSGCGSQVHIAYDEGGKIYCFSCAFSYGAIDEDEWREDNKDEEFLEELATKRKKGV